MQREHSEYSRIFSHAKNCNYIKLLKKVGEEYVDTSRMERDVRYFEKSKYLRIFDRRISNAQNLNAFTD